MNKRGVIGIIFVSLLFLTMLFTAFASEIRNKNLTKHFQNQINEIKDKHIYHADIRRISLGDTFMVYIGDDVDYIVEGKKIEVKSKEILNELLITVSKIKLDEMTEKTITNPIFELNISYMHEETRYAITVFYVFKGYSIKPDRVSFYAYSEEGRFEGSYSTSSLTNEDLKRIKDIIGIFDVREGNSISITYN